MGTKEGAQLNSEKNPIH